jgi:hypothetical protein
VSVEEGDRWRVFGDFEALGEIEPTDDRRLADGSRWVDAEALRLVALHVFRGAK